MCYRVMFGLIFYTLTQVSLMLSYEESELDEFDDEESETERLGAMTLIISETLLLYDKKYLKSKRYYNQKSTIKKEV